MNFSHKESLKENQAAKGFCSFKKKHQSYSIESRHCISSKFLDTIAIENRSKMVRIRIDKIEMNKETKQENPLKMG